MIPLPVFEMSGISTDNIPILFLLFYWKEIINQQYLQEVSMNGLFSIIQTQKDNIGNIDSTL